MRLHKNFSTKKIWPVSDLDPDPEPDPDPKLTSGQIRNRNRIRNTAGMHTGSKSASGFVQIFVVEKYVLNIV